jgi:hypothetical chaperone protein
VPSRVAELRQMRRFYADSRQHDRLMVVLKERLGHALAAAAEQAKIEAATRGVAQIDLSLVESGLGATLHEADAAELLENDCERIVAAARETLALAGVPAVQVDALYFTGGSTGLQSLVDRIAACFPAARIVRGDRFASVAQGLGEHARRVFDPTG